MDPVTLGIAASGLFAAKIIEKLGERTGDKIADGVGPIREHIAQLLESGPAEQGASLLQVERSPDSAIAVDTLAKAITAAAHSNPDTASQLAALVTELSPTADEFAGRFQVNLSDQARVDQIAQANRDINIQRD